MNYHFHRVCGFERMSKVFSEESICKHLCTPTFFRAHARQKCKSLMWIEQYTLFQFLARKYKKLAQIILKQSICRIFLFAFIPCSKILLNFWDRSQMLRKKHIFNLVREENPTMYEYILFWTSRSLRCCILCSRIQIWRWNGTVLSYLLSFWYEPLGALIDEMHSLHVFWQPFFEWLKAFVSKRMWSECQMCLKVVFKQRDFSF